MKKRRLLSLLLSAALAVGTMPAMLTVGASANIAEDVNLLDKLVPSSSMLIKGGNKYARVTNLEQKNYGATLTIPNVLEEGAIYSLSYKVRIMTLSSSSATAKEDASKGNYYEIGSSINPDAIRSIRFYLNDIQSLSSVNGGVSLKNSFSGSTFTKTYTTTVTEEGAEEPTEDTLPCLSTELTATDDQGWVSVNTVFLAGTNGVPLNEGKLKIDFKGGNSNGLKDLAPFDLDDIVLVKTDLTQVPEADDLASTVYESTSLYELDFEGDNSDDLVKLKSDVYVVDDEDDFYRIPAYNSDFSFGKTLVFTPGTYVFSGDFRLSGFNPDMMLSETQYQAVATANGGDWGDYEAADIARVQKENYREFQVQLYGDSANYKSLWSIVEGEPSGQATEAVKVGTSFDPNEWDHIVLKLVVPEGSIYIADKLRLRGGMTAQCVYVDGVVDANGDGKINDDDALANRNGDGVIDNLDALNVTLDHRALGFDAKNLSLVKTDTVEEPVYEWEDEEAHSESEFTFTEAGDSILAVEDETHWDNGAIETIGDDKNDFLSVYNMFTNQYGVVIRSSDFKIVSGQTYNITYDIRTPADCETRGSYIRMTLNGSTNYAAKEPLPEKWTTLSSTESVTSLTAASDGNLVLKIWGGTSGVTGYEDDRTNFFPFDIDNIKIYSYVDGENTFVGAIDFTSDNVTFETIAPTYPSEMGIYSETGNVISVETDATYTPAKAITLAPGKYELSGNFRLSEWSLDHTQNEKAGTTDDLPNYRILTADNNVQDINFGIGLESGEIVDANAEDASFEVTEAWTPLTYTFTVEEETALTSITLSGDENMPFYADELSLTLVELPEPEPEAVEITFAAGAGVASVGEGKLYYKNEAMWSDAECTKVATADDIPAITVITDAAGTQYRNAAWYNGSELVSDVLTLAPTEAVTLTAIAQPYYMVTFAFDEASEGVSIKYGEVTYTEGSFNTDYFKEGSTFPAITYILEEGCEYSWDIDLPQTVEGYVVYTIKGVMPVDTNYDIELCTDENLTTEGKQLVFVKSKTALKYNDEAMIYSELHGAYVAEVSADLDKNAIDALITDSEDVAPTVKSYDPNGNGVTTAGDAAYVNILIHGNNVSSLDLASRLACDANGDMKVTVSDCTKILKKSVGL